MSKGGHPLTPTLYAKRGIFANGIAFCASCTNFKKFFKKFYFTNSLDDILEIRLLINENYVKNANFA